MSMCQAEFAVASSVFRGGDQSVLHVIQHLLHSVLRLFLGASLGDAQLLSLHLM